MLCRLPLLPAARPPPLVSKGAHGQIRRPTSRTVACLGHGRTRARARAHVERCAPSDCKDMAEVREQIDRIDEQLVRLLAERFGFIERAWQVKEAMGTEAADVPWRVRQVVDNARAAAERCGLPPDLAVELWTKMVGYCVAYEAKMMDEGGKSR